MTTSQPEPRAGTTDLAPLLAAKGRLPLLPHPHVPRPRLTAMLADLVRTHRLVLLSAGSLAGKTALLAAFAHAPVAGMRVYWYAVDDVDETPRMLLEGLARAVSGTAPSGNEVRLLAHIVGALDTGAGMGAGMGAGTDTETALLILDDVHRSAASVPVVERLLRYLPPRARLLLSSHPGRLSFSPLWQGLEDQGQVAHLTGADLRLDTEEQHRFRAGTGRSGGAWAVEYRQGGQAAVVDRLRQGVLPALDPELRAVVDLLGVLPAATAPLLGAALSLSAAAVDQRLARLRDETILLERLDDAHDRLSETAWQAAQAGLDAEALAALRRAAAEALASYDPAQAAHLFAQAGAVERVVGAARRVSWWEWRRREALALAVAALLPRAALCASGALALVAAHTRLTEQGVGAAHGLIRALRAETPLERIERLRLLAHCCAARGRPWSLARCVADARTLAEARDPAMGALTRAYAWAVLGIAHGLGGDHRAAAGALRRGLDLLALAGGDDDADDADDRAAYVRFLSLRALAAARHVLGEVAEAEHLYDEAHARAARDGSPYAELELANNRAVLLQERGEHARSADLLRQALSSPWSAGRGLRGLLHASLADALGALDDRAGAARALHAALAEVRETDVYGLAGYLHAMLALLLAEGGHAAAAAAELAAGASPTAPAAYLARALLLDPRDAGARAALDEAVRATTAEASLHARAQAHLARVCALQGDRRRSRALVRTLSRDCGYPLTPREAAILGVGARRARGRAVPVAPADQRAAHVALRFFGPPMLSIGGAPLGSAWWSRAKGRELLWYALAHGAEGFTREEACADLFPEVDARAGGRCLRNLLHELRVLPRAHGSAATVLAEDAGRLRLLPVELGRSWESDLEALQTWLARLRAGDLDGVGNLPLLVAGGFPADLREEWTYPLRRHWECEAIRALDLAAVQYERAGHFEEALACWRRELEFCPDDETLVRRVLLLYHAAGDVSGIRATYAQHRRSLREEVGAEPGPDLAGLYAALARPVAPLNAG